MSTEEQYAFGNEHHCWNCDRKFGVIIKPPFKSGDIIDKNCPYCSEPHKFKIIIEKTLEQNLGVQVSSKKPFKLTPYVLILLSIIILGLTLQIYRLNYKSLWYDEICSVARSEKGIQYIIFDFGFGPGRSRVAPLHFVILNFFLYFGKSEFVVRLPSVIFGVLAILLTYKIGELFFGKKEGLISAFLLSISAMHIHYSQEARMYSLLMFLALLSLFLFYKVEWNDLL